MQTINTTTLNDQETSQEALRNIASMGHANLSASNNNNADTSAVKQDDDEALVDTADLLSSDRSGIDANNTPIRIATALVICTVFAFGVLVLSSFWGNLTGGNTVSQDELPETEESEKKVTDDLEKEIDNKSAKLALNEQKGDSLASKPKAQPQAQLVKEEPETVEAEPETTAPRPSRQPPSPRPTPQVKEVEVDPLEEWARLSNLGSASGSKEAAISHLNETNNLTASTSNSSSRIPSKNSTATRTPITRTTNPSLPKNPKTPLAEINRDELENAVDKGEVAQIASVSIGENTLPQGDSSENFENLSVDAINILNGNSTTKKYTSSLPSKPNEVENTINRLSSLGNQSALISPESETNSDLPEKIAPTNLALFNSNSDRNTQYVALNMESQQSQPKYTTEPVQDENDINLSNQPQSNSFSSRNPRLPSVKTKNSISVETLEEPATSQSAIDPSEKLAQINIAGKHQIPFGGEPITGELSTSVIWSEGIDSEQTRATINLNEPLLSEDGSIAVKANSSLVVEVRQIASSGLTILDVIAISYENSKGKLVQEALPPGAILIKGEDSQPLIAEKSSDSGGILFGQDLLISGLAAGARGFEVLNEPTRNTFSFDQSFDDDEDDFSRSRSRSSFNQTEDRDPSLLNGAGEGAFTSARERLEARSELIEEEELARTPIYQVEAGTPVSIYVNSFLEINN